jgi:transposase
MLLALLIYGYAVVERSSRRIERLCGTDVAFRLICAQDVPDHTVIARFRGCLTPRRRLGGSHQYIVMDWRRA